MPLAGIPACGGGFPSDGPQMVFADVGGNAGLGYVVKHGSILWPPRPVQRDTVEMRNGMPVVLKTEWETWVVRDGKWRMELVEKRPRRQKQERIPFPAERSADAVNVGEQVGAV